MLIAEIGGLKTTCRVDWKVVMLTEFGYTVVT